MFCKIPENCDYYPRNAQCLGNKCPYHPKSI